jgi:hypothetical protein
MRGAVKTIAIFGAGVLTGALGLQLSGHFPGSRQMEGEPARIADAPRVSLEPHKNVSDADRVAQQQEAAPERPGIPAPSPRAEPESESEWNALVGGMLEWQVERRTGRTLSAEQRDRLVSELSRLREASLSLQASPTEPTDGADLRNRLTQTLVLAQVDETFRKETGMGVSEFLQGLNPGAVEDVSPAP